MLGTQQMKGACYEERAQGRRVLQLRPGKLLAPEAPSISVFCKDTAGAIFHTYSCYARGLDHAERCLPPPRSGPQGTRRGRLARLHGVAPPSTTGTRISQGACLAISRGRLLAGDSSREHADQDFVSRVELLSAANHSPQDSGRSSRHSASQAVWRRTAFPSRYVYDT